MYVIVEHRISDPAKFWEKAQASIPQLPADVKVHEVFPSTDASRAVCLWEAGSIDRVKEFVESNVGPFSRNEYYELDAAKAFGLPSR
jgi:hypothetical protein